MSDPTGPLPSPPAPPPLPPPSRGDWREERRRERAERRAARHAYWGDGHGWAGVPVGALVLIGLGVFLLLQNFGYHLPDNWWALFLLIPAGGSLVAAIRIYRAEGAWTNEALGALIPAVIFLALFSGFFFNFAWGVFWPVILLAIGVGLLVRSYWR